MVSETFYEVLDIDSSADEDEVERAYREQVRRHHPDRRSGGTERMKRINKAKEVLTDPLERRRYDRIGHEEYIELERPAGWMNASVEASQATETESSSESGTGSVSGSTANTDPDATGSRSRSEQTGGRGETVNRRSQSRESGTTESTDDDASRGTSGRRSRTRNRSGRTQRGDSQTRSETTESDDQSETNRATGSTSQSREERTTSSATHSTRHADRSGSSTPSSDGSRTRDRDGQSDEEDADEASAGGVDENAHPGRRGVNPSSKSTSAKSASSTADATGTDSTARSSSSRSGSSETATGSEAADEESRSKWATVGKDATSADGISSSGDASSTTESRSTGRKSTVGRTRSPETAGRWEPSSDDLADDRALGDRLRAVASTVGGALSSNISGLSVDWRPGGSTGSLGSAKSRLSEHSWRRYAGAVPRTVSRRGGSTLSAIGGRIRSGLGTVRKSISDVGDDRSFGGRSVHGSGRFTAGVATLVGAVASLGSHVTGTAAGRIRTSKALDRLATERPWKLFAVPRTITAVLMLSGLALAFELATGSSPGWLALGAFLAVSVSLSTIRESSQLLLERGSPGRTGRERSSGRHWTDDWLVRTSAAGIIGVALFLLGWVLSGTAVLFQSLPIVARLSIVLLVTGAGGAFVATMVGKHPAYGGLTAGFVYVVPATLFLPPDSWLAGGGLPGGGTELWVPMVTLGPAQLGQLANVTVATAMVFGLAAPFFVFVCCFSTILRRDTLDRGYPFTPLSWELAALIPFAFGLVLAFAPIATIGPVDIASAARSLLLSSTLLWPTVFLGGYTLARLHHDGRLPNSPDDASSVVEG